MVSQIQLGNISNLNGKTVVFGGNSGIDTEALLKALGESRRLPAVQLETKIKNNEGRISAYNDLKTIFARFKDAADVLRNPPGVQNAAQNVFAYRSGSIVSNGSAIGTDYFTATISPGTVTGAYTVDNITSLAAAKKQESSVFAVADQDADLVVASPGAGQIGAGSITIKGQSITFVQGDSLREVSAKFNAVSTQTGIGATVVKVANNQFKLVFTATKTGTDANFNLNTGGGTVTGTPLDNVTFTQTQAAANAVFDIDGVTVTRQSNNVSDVIEGVTFNLKQTTTASLGLELTLNVEADTELAKNAVTNLVNAYNDFRLFYAQQTARNDDGTPKETSLLAGSSLTRGYLDTISAELTRTVSNLTGVKKLSDIGITFTDFAGDDKTPFTRNILTIDDAKLSSALSTNFTGVKNLFEFNMSSGNADISIFSRSNDLSVSNVSLTVNYATNTYTATYMENGSPVVVNLTAKRIDPDDASAGISLTAPDTGKLKGLVLLYTSSANTTVSLGFTQGIGDRLFNNLNSVLDTRNGTLTKEMETLSKTNTRLTEDIAKIDERVTTFKDQLAIKFAQMEATIAKVNNLLQSLQAQDDARYANN